MTNLLQRNILLDVDSYKISHHALYPKNITGLSSYIESRAPYEEERIVFFGLQMWIKKNLLTPFTEKDIEEAENFCKEHGEPFNKSGWEYILEKYNGYLPIDIYALPEGIVTKSQTPLVVVECVDPKVFWLASYIETSLLRGVWYPTTIASNDYKNYNMITKSKKN